MKFFSYVIIIFSFFFGYQFSLQNEDIHYANSQQNKKNIIFEYGDGLFPDGNNNYSAETLPLPNSKDELNILPLPFPATPKEKQTNIFLNKL